MAIQVSLSIIFLSLVVMTALVPVSAKAQNELEQEFALPDVPDGWTDYLRFKNDRFSIGGGLSVLLDYTTFSQNGESVAQVGVQEDKFEARSFRFITGGTLDFIGPVAYLLAAEYKGFGRDHGDPLFDLTDLAFTWKFRGRSDMLTIGKQKEPFSYEMVGNSANLLQHERFLEPFFRSRNIGVRYTSNFFNDRAGLSLGWYNDWLNDPGDISDNGNQLASRLTVLPVWLDGGASLLHLGLSVKYNESDDRDGVLRYRGRPGSHVSSIYVDSGDIAADHAWDMGLEALLQVGQVTTLAEYVRSWVSSADEADPSFWGWYLTASYVFHGDLRPYTQILGYSQRVKPYTKWGALEPLIRYGYVDLDDGGVDGGKMKKWYLGLNWWATPRWKVSVGYGDIDLERFDTTGNTKQLLMRLQWIGIF